MALRRPIADTDVKIKRVVRNFELVDEPDEDYIRDINTRRIELRAHKKQLEDRLGDLERRILHAPNPDLIDALPITQIDVEKLPVELARALFEALRLEIHYNKITNTATFSITLTGPTIAAASSAAHDATVIALDDHRKGRDQHKHADTIDGGVAQCHQPGPILVVPSAVTGCTT